MKKHLFFVVATVFFGLLFSCSADKAQPQSSNSIVDIVTQGTWKVTYYTDHGGNETMHFVAYTFSFRSDNTLVASNGSTEVIGNWNVTDNNNSPLYTDLTSTTDDSPTDPVDFNISFPVANLDFNDIEDDWDIVSKSTNEIVLKDGNADDETKTDFITFEKVQNFDLTTTLPQGTWQVGFYSDHGSDQTLNFTGYTFTFAANGGVTVTNGTAPVSGTWSITTNNNSPLYTAPATADDSPNDPVDFNLFFPLASCPVLLNDIEDDWDKVFVTNATIMLKDEVTANPALNDYIIFKKLP